MNPDSVYWRLTRRLTFSLLMVWVGVTFLLSWYADELNRFVFLGFPLGFYMGAQGTLLVYLLIVAVYCLVMNRLDARHGADQRRSRGKI